MIGVFDSGFGGLAIFKHILREMPEYNYVYLGDTARTPYGSRSQETILRFTKEAVDFLLGEGCELIIIACNTASAEALRTIQQEYLHTTYPSHKRVLGVIIPTLEEVASLAPRGRVGVLATEGSVMSGTFLREFKKLAPHAKLFQQAAPLLVPLIEAGEHRSPAARLILESYIAPLLDKKIDTLILGCTHYEHIERMAKRIVGKNVRVVSEGKIVARKLKEYLQRHPEIEAMLIKKGATTFCSTDSIKRFERLSRIFLGRRVTPRVVHFK